MQSARASTWFCISAAARMAGRARLSELNKAKVPGVFGHTSPTSAQQRSKHSRKRALVSDSSQVSSIMANKQTGLINRPYFATSLLFLVVPLSGYSVGPEEQPVFVRADRKRS